MLGKAEEAMDVEAATQEKRVMGRGQGRAGKCDVRLEGKVREGKRRGCLRVWHRDGKQLGRSRFMVLS